MESTRKPELFLKYGRRNRRDQQECSKIDVCLPVSSSGDQKKDCGEKLPSETLCNPDASMKMKCRAEASDFEAYMPESHVLGQCRGSIHGRNSLQRGTRKRKAKDDSSDSEIYTPRPRARGQRRNALHCSNSISQRGMLNTQMFQLYFENIWSGISEEKRKSFAYLDSLWFSLYRNGYKEKVLNWIKKKDIFSKQYVLVPIVLWSHWTLLILCQFTKESKSSSPCIVLLDSLQSANQSLEPEIRKFVLDIYRTQERQANRESIKHIPFLVPKVPQQNHGEECGCYVLFYANLFLENAPESFSFSDDYPYFMTEDWFSPKSLDDFRNRLGSVAAKSSSLCE